MGIVIENSLVMINKEGADQIVKANVYIEEDRIVGISEKPKDFISEKRISGKNRLLLPGFINCHTHSYMSIFRNVADDLSFGDWLFHTVMPLEEKMIPEDAYWGASLAILEMMKSGTTCFSDMQMHIGQTSKAVKESGMRARIGRGLVGSGTDEAGSSRLREALEEKKEFRDCKRLTYLLAPHAVYTCDEEYLRVVAKIAKEENLPIHIHLSESRVEVENAKKEFGCTPIALCEKAGIFENRTIAAHCVHVTKEDIEILRRNQVSVVTNPASNMKLGNGFAPIPAMLEAGINVCIGTDGAASNNTLNLFHELSLLTLIHKGNQETAQCISAKEAFAIATRNGAKAIGLSDEIGTIEIGKKADLILLKLDTPSFMPQNNLLAGISYSANGSEVDTVIIDGKVTMENRKVLTMDEEKIYAEVTKICKRLGIDKKEY
jgi:5-methylthioadenosine/S-adenosylhomocysteine deaminase